MAKEDFCFTYYDGDATRDTSHMNRLERGAYHDLVIAQRKFGHLTLDQIKKILGRDFSECWPAIELIMKYEDEKLYIEWLDKSIKTARLHAKHQSANGKLGGRPKKQSESHLKTNTNPNENGKKPLGNGDGDEYGDVLGSENENGKFLVPEMFKKFKKNISTYPGSVDLDYKPLLSIAKFLLQQGGLKGNLQDNSEEILIIWEKGCQIISEDNFYRNKSLSTISNHIQEIVQIGINGKSNSTAKGGKPVSASSAFRKIDRMPG